MAGGKYMKAEIVRKKGKLYFLETLFLYERDAIYTFDSDLFLYNRNL